MPQRWLTSLQFDVCQNCKRTCKHPWIFIELDQHLENAKDVKVINFDRAHLWSTLFGDEP